ncbi:MAG: alanine-tRNA synthetase second additional domain-containing protein, partial [Bacteroidales bacterium]|nr:alanine-tRNA synthetase second additional domain-containing protein [Bacteroidales bacterium]
DKLPDDASETIRLVKIGDYDLCCCIGKHVERTKEIGEFKINSTSYIDGNFRIVFKLIGAAERY